MKIQDLSRPLYHGSMQQLEVGTILSPRNQAYEDDWGHTGFYEYLEKYRPSNSIAHRDAVFMVDNEDDVDVAGGGTEWLFTVQPLGPVERHDMNWGSEISMLLDDEHNNQDKIKQAAINYWNGVPHTNESVWEYLTTSAKILHVEEY